jgi:hypothetical protein
MDVDKKAKGSTSPFSQGYKLNYLTENHNEAIALISAAFMLACSMGMIF